VKPFKAPSPASPSTSTLLGDHGEGYCTTCQFIIPLLPAGTLATHRRDGSVCEGSLGKPPRRTPYYSRKSAFRVTAKKVTCPACNARVTLRYDDRMASTGHRLEHCPGRWRRPEELQR
jgi:hypothetical protein